MKVHMAIHGEQTNYKRHGYLLFLIDGLMHDNENVVVARDDDDDGAALLLS